MRFIDVIHVHLVIRTIAVSSLHIPRCGRMGSHLSRVPPLPVGFEISHDINMVRLIPIKPNSIRRNSDQCSLDPSPHAPKTWSHNLLLVPRRVPISGGAWLGGMLLTGGYRCPLLRRQVLECRRAESGTPVSHPHQCYRSGSRPHTRGVPPYEDHQK